ncbi:response regulator transcription factor [Photobacterium swingsii]|uniref:DNA-binding response regulator n=1 Tax=Photobacterium swingsii TaxID=680026 RepID=A0A0J8VI07_9GAMM|nr:response regulator transcription factor [Photobacterium swingsii]KMV32100.1 chemotaxis protein CheY [Photobacterium swingsii]PSW26879.1 DNA-binding response regulator [Photobacterium swingsii]
MKVLIVEDNPQIIETISDYLSLDGATVDCAYHGEGAISLLEHEQYDVIVMDIMMPKLNGIHTVEYLRQELRCDIPILFLTAKNNLSDKIAAFQAGGDDYLVKPFALEELHLRLQALANRGPRQDIGILKFADISIDPRTEQVTRANSHIKLSRIQFLILQVLMKKAPALISKQELITAVWGENAPSSDALRSHVYGLRNAIDKDFPYSRLETIHGKGYRLKA